MVSVTASDGMLQNNHCVWVKFLYGKELFWCSACLGALKDPMRDPKFKSTFLFYTAVWQFWFWVSVWTPLLPLSTQRKTRLIHQEKRGHFSIQDITMTSSIRKKLDIFKWRTCQVDFYDVFQTRGEKVCLHTLKFHWLVTQPVEDFQTVRDHERQSGGKRGGMWERRMGCVSSRGHTKGQVKDNPVP